MKNKFEGHPYKSDYTVIKSAFEALKKDQNNILMNLRGYKGVTVEAFDQLTYENERISEVQKRVFRLLDETLRNTYVDEKGD